MNIFHLFGRGVLQLCLASAFVLFLSAPVLSIEQTIHPQKIRLASTIGPIDAGILRALEEAYRKVTGIVVEHIGAGTSQARTLRQ